MFQSMHLYAYPCSYISELLFSRIHYRVSRSFDDPPAIGSLFSLSTRRIISSLLHRSYTGRRINQRINHRQRRFITGLEQINFCHRAFCFSHGNLPATLCIRAIRVTSRCRCEHALFYTENFKGTVSLRTLCGTKILPCVFENHDILTVEQGVYHCFSNLGTFVQYRKLDIFSYRIGNCSNGQFRGRSRIGCISSLNDFIGLFPVF